LIKGCVLLSGGPDWLRKDEFDIIAKLPDNAPDYTLNLVQFQRGGGPEVQLMLQALLTDRFHLKVRREQKPGTVFALTVGKKGSKLEKADGSEKPGVMFHTALSPSGQQMIQLIVKNSTMQEVANMYTKVMDRPVLDQTGLKDRYDFTIDYEANADAPGPFTELNGPALFSAFEQQAGLKFETIKGLVPMLVIEHAEKPTAN
jgi:uncharacterized protein (TIGR03435 family)